MKEGIPKVKSTLNLAFSMEALEEPLLTPKVLMVARGKAGR